MASLSDIKIIVDLRPCLVNGKKALFHRWDEHAEVIPPSPLVGGTNGGQVRVLFGLIEDENGQVIRVNPTCIRFLDNKIQEYCFDNLEGSSQEVE